jgi:hypothetical protein
MTACAALLAAPGAAFAAFLATLLASSKPFRAYFSTSLSTSPHDLTELTSKLISADRSMPAEIAKLALDGSKSISALTAPTGLSGES